MQKIKKVLFAEIDSDGKILKEEEFASPIPVVKNHFNARFFPKNGEVNNSPSMTIPDQAMTVEELLRRFASGLPLGGNLTGQYDGDEETIDLDRLDLAERQQILEEAREEIRQINERVDKRRKDAAERKLAESVEARLKAKADKKAQYEALKKEFENPNS